ncbi:unnamed protein product [Paramecium sonneborni]|uniref:Transmembrane protein n=1 Tax=Paramecium sonneborni TaxID=65129 RepID=A0A8S1MBA4_9CILI|nr:unnamed protein product [Paramecium sonneborni]
MQLKINASNVIQIVLILIQNQIYVHHVQEKIVIFANLLLVFMLIQKLKNAILFVLMEYKLNYMNNVMIVANSVIHNVIQNILDDELNQFKHYQFQGNNT